MLKNIERNIFEYALALACICTSIIMFKICLSEPLKYKIDNNGFCQVELITTNLINVVNIHDGKEDHKKYYINCYYKYEDTKYNQVVVYDDIPKLNSKSYAIMDKQTRELVCVIWYDNIMWICIMFLAVALLIIIS